MLPVDPDSWAESSVARLATVRPEGSPHLVPITFALQDGEIVTAVDHKPKRHQRLQRLANIEANPQVSVLIDHWDDDWSRLWWVRVDGRAVVHDIDPGGIAALAAKYSQYVHRPPRGPMIRITIENTASWRASP